MLQNQNAHSRYTKSNTETTNTKTPRLLKLGPAEAGGEHLAVGKLGELLGKPSETAAAFHVQHCAETASKRAQAAKKAT